MNQATRQMQIVQVWQTRSRRCALASIIELPGQATVVHMPNDDLVRSPNALTWPRQSIRCIRIDAMPFRLYGGTNHALFVSFNRSELSNSRHDQIALRYCFA